MTAENRVEEFPSLAARLAPDVSLEERLRGLWELGLSPGQVRKAVSVSAEAMRLWTKGGTVRASNRRVLDDIAKAASLVLEAAGSPAAAATWLTSPVEGARAPAATPLELIRRQARPVLAAAEAHAAGRSKDEKAFLLQAAEGSPTADATTGAPHQATDLSTVQAHQLLFAHLHQIIANHASSQEVLQQLETGYKPELERLPNYESLQKTLSLVKERLRNAGNAPPQPVLSKFLREATDDEERLWGHFEALGRRLIVPNMTILTYALSMRVMQVLWGADEEAQRTSRLLIAEGRVKALPQDSELPSFADAAEVFRFLDQNGYERILVPDSVAPHLLERKQEREARLLLLGAQKVYRNKDRRPTHFVASAGTNALLRAAKAGGAKVVVVAEESKVADVEEEPQVEFRDRVVSVRLPSAGGGKRIEYAPLLTVSAELCFLDPEDERAVADPSVVKLINRDGPVSW